MSEGDLAIYSILGILAVLYLVSLIGEKTIYKDKRRRHEEKR